MDRSRWGWRGAVHAAQVLGVLASMFLAGVVSQAASAAVVTIEPGTTFIYPGQYANLTFAQQLLLDDSVTWIPPKGWTFDGVSLNLTKTPSAWPGALVNVTTWDPIQTHTGSVSIAFTATAPAGSTLYVNLSGLIPLYEYIFKVDGHEEYRRSTVAMTGAATFSWAVWSTRTFEIVLGLPQGSVTPGPGKANVTAGFDTIVNGRTVTFLDRSSATNNSTVSSWRWYFGDGKASNETQPTHAYALQGLWTTYRVVLVACTAAGDCGTASQDVTLYDWPLVFLILGLAIAFIAAVAVVVRRS